MLEALMQECVYNKGSATGQKTNRALELRRMVLPAIPDSSGWFWAGHITFRDADHVL